MELRAHDVVVVTGEDGGARARLPVPDADRLVVRRRHDPRVLRVKLHSPDVVKVAEQREEAPAQLVVPHLDLVVVAAGDEERLRRMEAHAAHRSVMLVEPLEQRAHPVVPQLHDAIVQRREHPRPVGVEGEALDAVGFGLKLGQHPARPCERTSGARVRALRWPRREARIARCRGALRPRTTAGRPVSRARAPSWTMQLLSAWPRDGGRPGMGVVSRSRAQRTARSRCESKQVQDESLLARKLTSDHTFEGRHEWCTKVQSSSNT